MLSKTLIYLVPPLPCLLSSSPLFVSGIPLTHHSSSHLPPLPPVSPYLSSSVLTFLSFQHSPFMFFFRSMSVLILPHDPLLPKALPRPGFLCCNDTDKLFGHSCTSLMFACFSFFSFTILRLPRSPPTLRQGDVYSKARRTRRPLNTRRIHTHTPCSHLHQLFINSAA